MQKLVKLDKLKEDQIHDITIGILSKYNFDEKLPLNTLTDTYIQAYVEVYNCLVDKTKLICKLEQGLTT
mgnify:CR=1 FL=1